MTECNNAVSWEIVQRLVDQLAEASVRCAAAEAEFERAHDALWDAEESVLASGTIGDKLKVIARRHAAGLDMSTEAKSVLAELAAA